MTTLIGVTPAFRPSDHQHSGYRSFGQAEYAGNSTVMPNGLSGGTEGTVFPEDRQSTQTELPGWFNSGFRPLGARNEAVRNSDLEIDRQEESARSAPEPHVVENSTQVGPQLDEDGSVKARLLQNYVLDDIHPSKLESGGQPGRFKLTGSRVLVKRAPKANELAMEAIQRETDFLKGTSDSCVPRLLEMLESDIATWTVIDYASGRTLREYINAAGPQHPETIKGFTTQLFSGVASIFTSGFAHLRICDETILISPQGRLIITNFEYVYSYGKEKIDSLYASVQDKCGDDIYVAPEVFADIKYNARKAVIWSCGVVLYFITTATTTPLSVLNHPSFDSPTSDSTDPTTPSSRPRNLSITDATPSRSRRKLSTASQQALKVPLISYPTPGGRLSVPAWTRDIISKMLQVSPLRRAELIEVAAKVPKEFHLKDARPLMELAWLDYKHHVGPLAGLSEGGGDSERNSLFSFSGMSAFSRESLGMLLPGRRRSTVAKAKGGVTVAELGESESSRRKSTWL